MTKEKLWDKLENLRERDLAEQRRFYIDEGNPENEPGCYDFDREFDEYLSGIDDVYADDTKETEEQFEQLLTDDEADRYKFNCYEFPLKK